MTYTMQQAIGEHVRAFVRGIPLVWRGLDPDRVQERAELLIDELLMLRAELAAAKNAAAAAADRAGQQAATPHPFPPLNRGRTW
jgi:hypothetical protein